MNDQCYQDLTDDERPGKHKQAFVQLDNLKRKVESTVSSEAFRESQ